MQKKIRVAFDRQFQSLATQVNDALIRNDGLIGDQKAQVDLMHSLERKFQFYIQKYAKTLEIYRKFVHFIMEENGNILNARPFFREKSTVFNTKISKDLKECDAKSLMKYKINYMLIKFIVDRWGEPLPEKVQRYYNDFVDARRILIENNLPLAINRAKLFYRKTPRSALTLLDLIDICAKGLINGIDKYVGDYTRVWRSVCIGRMVGDMIEKYSETFLRLYPNDKKILYRANSLRYKMHLESIEDITKAVNNSFMEDKANNKPTPKLPIEEEHIRTLINGIGYTSTESEYDYSDNTGEEGSLSTYDFTATDEDVEANVVHSNMIRKVSEASRELRLVEKKIIKLKGVNLDNF